MKKKIINEYKLARDYTISFFGGFVASLVIVAGHLKASEMDMGVLLVWGLIYYLAGLFAFLFGANFANKFFILKKK